ncbi:MAG: biotin/lipoate A/B protein ligase family protein [Candidatus Omnitrophica bacterium]|nr:biotin/lipoate A/B protein ligase family protein [Candidatus Omnitrophota bacterium]
MLLLNHSITAPEDNIALDEAMLLEAERGGAGETVRFWESEEHFIVLGRACDAFGECDLEAAARDGVKVIRRLSGGGTVLQGPGCLNYSLVLSYESDPQYRTIRSSYGAVLRRISMALHSRGIAADIMPLSDMAVAGRKFSGNAQARKKKYFLHHGTLLYAFDIGRTGLYLKHPPAEPEYRKGRGHGEFIANIPLSRVELEKAVKESFPVSGERGSTERTKELAQKLVDGKYSRKEWNLHGKTHAV